MIQKPRNQNPTKVRKL